MSVQSAVKALSTSEMVRIPPDDITIGRDVLELVSGAMYVDPMTIYREYVQNAADAIDDARRQGLLTTDEPGRVDITFDTSTRSVRIRDNGSGIAWPHFVRRLTGLGASGKRGTSARGFRGVGRLAGLGYAQELIFRSRASGENRVAELRWDCRRLRASLRGAEADTGIVELIRSIVQAFRIEPEDYPERFFEVELKGIVRHRSDKLFNPAAIAEYLGQVAPVPFVPYFRFGAEITAALHKVVDLGEIDLRVEGLATPVCKPHQNAFGADEKRAVSFENVEFVEIPGIDGNIAAIAWVLHHNYEGAVPTAALIKGLRLRTGNVQVGDYTLLEELFPEPRFNAWSVGEVHVIDRRIIPNGRRDHFEQNAHFHNIINHLGPLARNIARRCRTSSIRRKWLREFDLHRQTVQQKLGIIAQGSLAPADCEALAVSIEPVLLQMEKIAGKELLIEDRPEELRGNVEQLRAEVAAVMQDQVSDTSPLARLPPDRRAMYEHLFSLVYACSVNRVAAKALVDRILIRLLTAGGPFVPHEIARPPGPAAMASGSR